MELFFILVAAVFGLVCGSFFNVCIYRIPRDLSIVAPPSHCPKCEHRLPFWLNVPLLTYVLLRGRCYFCREPISVRYPLVELLTGLLFGAAALRFGLTPALARALILIFLLVPVTFIDLEFQIIPDGFSLPGIVIGLAGCWWWGGLVPWWEFLLGAAFGWLSLWLVATGYHCFTGRDGMGGGDLKLLAMLGAFLGCKALLPIILLSSLSGAVIGVGLVLWQGRDGRYAIPFGPFLAAGGLLYLFYGPQLLDFYWGLVLPA
ncbi:MAG: prepilin peptidase [Deltaproteobacteria bacterium]|nr:MAG: prepilin peptidase [Deltaproteobacteria bacterium]